MGISTSLLMRTEQTVRIQKQSNAMQIIMFVFRHRTKLKLWLHKPAASLVPASLLFSISVNSQDSASSDSVSAAVAAVAAVASQFHRNSGVTRRGLRITGPFLNSSSKSSPSSRRVRVWVSPKASCIHCHSSAVLCRYLVPSEPVAVLAPSEVSPFLSTCSCSVTRLRSQDGVCFSATASSFDLCQKKERNHDLPWPTDANILTKLDQKRCKKGIR